MGKETLGSTISAPALAGGFRSSAASFGQFSPGISSPIGFEGPRFSQASAFRGFSPETRSFSQLTSSSVPRPTLTTPDIFSSSPVIPNIRSGIEMKFGGNPGIERFSNLKPKAFREKLISPSRVVSRVENFKWNKQEPSKSKEGVFTVSFNEKVTIGSNAENVRKMVEVPTYRPSTAQVTIKRQYRENIFLTNVQRTEIVQSKISVIPKEVAKMLPRVDNSKLPDAHFAPQVDTQPGIKTEFKQSVTDLPMGIIKEASQVETTLTAILKIGLGKATVLDTLNKTLADRNLKIVEVPQTQTDSGGNIGKFLIVATGQKEQQLIGETVQRVKEFKLDIKALENRKQAGAQVVNELFAKPEAKLAGIEGWQIAEKLNEKFTGDKKKFTSAINVEDDPTPVDTARVLANKLRTVWSANKAHEEVERTIFYNPPVAKGKGIPVSDEEVDRVIFGKADPLKPAGLLKKGDQVLNVVVAKAENNLSSSKK